MTLAALAVHHLAKSFNLTQLFHDVTFSFNPGDRVGLIGPNGSGKTTLLRIIMGEESADAGQIVIAPTVRIGYLAQGFSLDPSQTVGETIGAATGSADVVEDELAHVATRLSRHPEDAALQRQYDMLLQRLLHAGDSRTASMLAALELDTIDPDLPVAVLSGGQKTRLALALILLEEPQLLLLDEPTNHLDIAMLEWLEQWLSDYPGGALIISHDRTFLDRTVNRIVELDPHALTTREWAGNYSDYLTGYLQEREKQWAAFKDQQYEIRRMKQDIAQTREQSNRVHRATTPRNPGARARAKKVMRKAVAREKKLVRYIESDDRVEKPARSWQMNLDFGDVGHLGQVVLQLDELSVGYPEIAPLLTDLNETIQVGQRVVLTGPNGSGKTTLLRTIAGLIRPIAGSFRLGNSIELGYMSQEQKLLDMDLSPLETIQLAAPLNETEARSFLHYFLFADDEPLKPNHHLSFGQRARLSLALLVARGCNFLLLDEPINHLDIPSRTMFEEALLNYDGTILAVVHDRYFIDRFATDVWWVEEGNIRVELRRSTIG
ncbi:MAG: ATP-binding cassette domain-containing protein [Anaerolineae bacterium]|nr:ATP-binding cassette domain-containing protein [Anaerolineae bacterium]